MEETFLSEGLAHVDMMYLHVPVTKLPVKEKNALKPAQKSGVTFWKLFSLRFLEPLLLPGSTFPLAG